MVQALIKTHKTILQESINEKVGDITAQQSLSQLFKPLTEKIETTIKAILALPTLKAITLSQYPYVQAIEELPSEAG